MSSSGRSRRSRSGGRGVRLAPDVGTGCPDMGTGTMSASEPSPVAEGPLTLLRCSRLLGRCRRGESCRRLCCRCGCRRSGGLRRGSEEFGPFFTADFIGYLCVRTWRNSRNGHSLGCDEASAIRGKSQCSSSVRGQLRSRELQVRWARYRRALGFERLARKQYVRAFGYRN